jgi:hypothetical protein
VLHRRITEQNNVQKGGIKTGHRLFATSKALEFIQNHENEYACSIGQGEARDRKYKRLKLGGGQSYDRSSDYTAVVAGATKDRARSAVFSLD